MSDNRLNDGYYICKNGHEIAPPCALWSEHRNEFYCPKCGELLIEYKEKSENDRDY